MRKIFYGLLIILILLFGMWLLRAPLLEGAANWLKVEDKLVKADAIVVLAGDNNGERVNQAVELFREGYAPKLVMSGGPLSWHLTSAKWMQKQALTMGVPKPAIILEEKSLSTIGNAEFTLPIIKQHSWTSIILVTSPFHTRRASRVFKKVFSPALIKVITYPVQKSKFNPKGWWRRHEDQENVMWEYIKSIYYLLKGF